MILFSNRFLIISLLMIFLNSAACAVSRALLVGIGDYNTNKTGWKKVHGDADVSLLLPVLKDKGYKVTTLINHQATKDNILKALRQLEKDSHAGDKVYFHFSGHGQRLPDFNGDEKDGYDEAIVPYDALRSPGYATPTTLYNGENHIVDDELAPLFESIRKKIGNNGELFAVFDACYSRGIEKGGEENLSDEFDVDNFPEYYRGTSDIFTPSDNSYLLKLPLPLPFRPGCLTAIITASLENERNFEVKINGRYYGSLTYCVYLLFHRSVPLKEWIPYFQNGDYRTSGCFQSFQHPSITVYK